MRSIISSLCLCLAFSLCAFGQVNKSNPLGGTIREKYVGAESKAIIEVELLKESDPALSAPTTSISNMRMIVITVTEKLPSGELRVNSVGKQATPIPLDDPQSLIRAFQVEISATGISNLTSTPIRLPKNWESFSYQISCEIAGDPSPKTTAILDMQKPTGAVSVQNFNVKIGDPIWIQDSTGAVSTDLIVPITSTSASLVADVISKQGTTETKTEQPVVLLKGTTTPVKLNVQSFGQAQAIEIRVKPTELDTVQLILVGTGCDNTPNDPFCAWTPSFKQAFQINQTDSDLKNLKITSLKDPKIIRVRTTASAKNGTMKARLNGDPISLEGSGNSFVVTFDTNTLRRLNEDNTLEFEGESFQGIKLSEKPFAFKRNTKPELVTYPTFTLENNSLKLVYELSGDVEASEPKLTYRDTAGTAGTFRNPNCVAQDNGNTKCSPELTVSIDDSFKKNPRIPVKLEILAKERGGNQEPVRGSSIGFDLLNQGAIKAVLDEIRTNWKANRQDNVAIQRIATEVLKVEATNDKVRETFDKYVKEPDTSDKRKKFFDFLIGVGNFALKGFGIPITIPANLAG